MWNIFRFAKLKFWFVKCCNAFELLLKTTGRYLMQHVWNLFLSSSVSVTLEKKFIVVGFDFRKIRLYVPLVGFTKCNFICTDKSAEPAQSCFPCVFSLLSVTANCRRGFILEKCLRDKVTSSHALTKFQIFRETSYSVTVGCPGIVLIKFKRIPGCFHLFIIQQHMWNVSTLSHLIRCFGVLVSFISVCLLPFPATSAITFRLKQKVMVRAGASAGEYPMGGTAPRSSRKQWRTWHKCVDFAEQGRVVCSKTKRMEILMRCRKLSLVFL